MVISHIWSSSTPISGDTPEDMVGFSENEMFYTLWGTQPDKEVDYESFPLFQGL